MDHSLAQAAATSAMTLWFALYILPEKKQRLTCRYFIIIQTPGSISKKFQITIKVIDDSLKAVIKKKWIDFTATCTSTTLIIPQI